MGERMLSAGRLLRQTIKGWSDGREDRSARVRLVLWPVGFSGILSGRLHEQEEMGLIRQHFF